MFVAEIVHVFEGRAQALHDDDSDFVFLTEPDQFWEACNQRLTFSLFKEIHEFGFFEEVIAFGLHFEGHLSFSLQVKALIDVWKFPFANLSDYLVLTLEYLPDHRYLYIITYI